MRTFNVQFVWQNMGEFKEHHDETQFDIQDGFFEDMFNELTSLFNTFSDENYWDFVRITSINEVDYDGLEDE